MNKIISFAVVLAVIFCFLSCHSEEKDVFATMKATDVPLGIPQRGDWLADHPEKGQTFEEYSALNTLKVDDEHRFIYIQPIGNFNAKESKILDLTVEYLELFYGVKTKKLEPISDNLIPKNKRRLNEMGSEQLDASYILDSIMPQRKPNDALVVMGLSSKDLYPKPSWNFVFGLATYSKGVGVTSFFRYEPNNEDYRLCLRRTIRTSAHEIGHMFYMKHCTHAMCVMNGSNSLSEDDRKPNTLCSVCLKKMHLNFGFDTKKRLKSLLGFYQKYQLTKDVDNIQKQLQTLQY